MQNYTDQNTYLYSRYKIDISKFSSEYVLVCKKKLCGQEYRLVMVMNEDHNGFDIGLKSNNILIENITMSRISDFIKNFDRFFIDIYKD
jgi:hypothetical protein